MSETPILQDTDRTSGRDALRKNITAAMALSGAVRSTLGPKGLDKLLLDDEGRTLVTNDGVTVLETARVEHPVAKMLIQASSLQDRVARDGTTSTVVLCAEMLQNAWHLVSEGVHPSTIARGYQMAEKEAIAHLQTLTFQAEDDDAKLAVSSCLAGKTTTSVQSRIADLALEAASAVAETDAKTGSTLVDATRVKIVTLQGRNATESEVVEGLVLAKKRANMAMPAHLKSGKILLLSGGIEPRSLRGTAKLQITSQGMLDSFRANDAEGLSSQVETLKELGVNVLAVSENIDESVHRALVDAGIQAFRRVAKSDLDLVARATGATIQVRCKDATKQDLGTFTSSHNKPQGAVHHWRLTAQGNSATFIARGTSETMVGEVERCFADALGVAGQLLEDPSLLAGGGATHVALARHLRRYAETIPGGEAMAIEAYADALEVIPRALSENAGLDPIDSLLSIVAEQTKAENSSQNSVDSTTPHFIGLNLSTNEPTDMRKLGVIEPLSVIQPTIVGAGEAVSSILRIDDVLWAKDAGQEYSPNQ